MPYLSVLIPALNAQTTIRRALLSTLSALPSDSEVVVLDDGSQDRTAEMVESLRDRRVRLIQAAPTSGVAMGLQSLLVLSDSLYVARMDADDLSLPWRFNGELSALEAGAADAVFGTAIRFSTACRLRPQGPLSLSSKGAPLALLLANPFVHSSLVAQRSAISAVGGYRAVPSEDYDLWLRLAVGGFRLQRLARPTVLYRVHDSQVSAQESWLMQAADPALGSSHADLANSIFSRQFAGAFEQLRGVRSPSGAEALHALATAIAERVPQLGWTDRRVLTRLLRRASDQLST